MLTRMLLTEELSTVSFLDPRGLDGGKAAQEVHVPVPEGCTDPNATNFDPTARSDDGSCSYALQAFWDFGGSNQLINAGVIL